MSSTTQEELAMGKAKVGLMAKPDSAFFASLCFSLKHIWDNSVSTAGTDGLSIRYNTNFFMSLDKEEQIFLLLHETMHVAYLHPLRGEAFPDHDRANAAMDYVINLQLVERGFKMPKCGLLDRAYAGMSFEQVYQLLPPGTKPQWPDVKPMEDGSENQSDGKGRAGQKASGSQVKTAAELAAAAAAHQRAVEDILVRAAIHSKMANDKAGTIPGTAQLMLDALLNPKLPWQKILIKHCRKFTKSDYTWKKPNRRYFPDHYLPSLAGEKLEDLAISVDISGSVTDHDFHVFVSEVASIFKTMAPEKITLIQFDTKLQHVDVVKNIKELLALKFHGRGGTNVTPVIEWAIENKPQLLLIFTDGEFRKPQIAAPCSTLWMIHNNPRFTADFGKVIHYTI